METVVLDLIKSLEEMVLWANIKDGSPSQPIRDSAIKAISDAKKTLNL